MTANDWTILAGSALLGVGLWLLLPRPGRRLRWIGGLLAAVGVGFFGALVPPLGDWLGQSLFVVLAAVTVLAAIGAVTFRSPVYCAVWFAVSLLGTAGLFFVQGAQFLGVATIVVYAGAILVTLLFVLMLANPEGHAPYDRRSWEAPLAAIAGAAMVGVLTTAAVTAAGRLPDRAAAPRTTLQSDHVAALGQELFSRHLIAVEVAGTLLLVGLIGAVAIVIQSRKMEQAERERESAPSGGN